MAIRNTSHTEDFVEDLYLKIGIKTPQDLKFQTISEGLAIRSFYWPEPCQALFLQHQGFIFLNEQLSPQQKWQNFCHELAHILLHTGNQCRMPESFRTYQEAKANQFMYHAAVPSFMLDKLNLYECDAGTVYEVQIQFNVEYEFALQRLRQYINNKKSMLNWNIKNEHFNETIHKS